MTPTNDVQHSGDPAHKRPHENMQQNSVDDDVVIDGLSAAVESAFSAIREIDSADFEPAAIFVPTLSERQ